MQQNTGDDKKCPFCGLYTRNWLGKCKNRRCVSYRKLPEEAVNEMVASVKAGRCPSCNSKLSDLSATVYGDGRESLHIECSNGDSLSCYLLGIRIRMDL